MSEMVSESRSSVEIGQTAKGDPVVKVKVYAETLDLEAVDEAAAKAITVYRSTCQEVGA
jgi:hypothetical protein